MDLCKYKDIIGKPNTGVHKYRFLGVAIIDVIVTIIGGYLIAIFFKLPILYTIIGLFILGIIAHRLFCVRTTIYKLLFPN
jgi:uncharacterized membrane protein